jgi:hypothetical protein
MSHWLACRHTKHKEHHGSERRRNKKIDFVEHYVDTRSEATSKLATTRRYSTTHE